MKNFFICFMFCIFLVTELFCSGLVRETEKQLGDNCYKMGSRVSIIIDSHRQDIKNARRVFFYPLIQTVLIETDNELLLFQDNKLEKIDSPARNKINDFEFHDSKLLTATDNGLYIGKQKKISNMSILALAVYDGQLYISTPGKVYSTPYKEVFKFTELKKHRIFGPLLINEFQIGEKLLLASDDTQKNYMIVGGIISPYERKSKTPEKSVQDRHKSISVTKLRNEIKPFDNYLDNKYRVNLLNFLNGMNLKKLQYTQLIDLALKARNTRKKYKAKINENRAKANSIIGQMYVKLMKGYKLEKKFLSDVSNICGAVDPVKHQLHGALCDLEQQVLDVFTPIEKQLVKDFVPCIVPPLGLSDPIRIGQAGYSYADKKFLDDVRTMSQIEYFKKKDQLVKYVITEAQNEFGLIGKETTEYLENKIGNVLTKARELSPIDYEIQREDMAVQINKENLEAYLKNKREDYRRKVQRYPGKVDFLFLNDFSIDIYRYKISLLENKEI